MRVQTLTPLQPEYPCLPLPGFQFSLLKTNTSYFKIQKSLMWLDPLTGTGTLLYHAFRNCSHDRSVQPRSVGDTTGPAPGSQLTNREGLCKHSPCMGGGGWRTGVPSCVLARPSAAVHVPAHLLWLALRGPVQCSGIFLCIREFVKVHFAGSRSQRF